MPRAIVIGSPITHSLSPILHETGYAARGLTDWSYGRADVEAAELPAFMRELDDDIVGVSVTMPCKEAALHFADSADALADEVGAANTLVGGKRASDGHSRPEGVAEWSAYNTDVEGIFQALLAKDVGEPESAVIVGSGATARSAVAAICKLGVQDVTFVARAEARRQTLALARTYNLATRVVRTDSPNVAQAFATADLIVQTTPGHASDDLAAGLRAPRGHGVALDVVYADWPTPFASALAEHGWKVASGLEMLVYQAAEQFELFTGVSAPVSDMMNAAVAHMKR